MKAADSDKTGRRPCRSPCSRGLWRLSAHCYDNCPRGLLRFVLTVDFVSAVNGFEIRFMKSGSNSGSDTKTGLAVIRFQPDGLLKSQIRLFYAIEVTLYGGFGDSEFSGYDLPRGTA